MVDEKLIPATCPDCGAVLSCLPCWLKGLAVEATREYGPMLWGLVKPRLEEAARRYLEKRKAT